MAELPSATLRLPLTNEKINDKKEGKNDITPLPPP